MPSRGTRRTLANTHRLGTALGIALVLLLITGCTMCPLLSGRRSSDEPTPIAESVAGAATPEPTPDAATLVQALEDGDWETRLAAAHAVPEREDIPLPDRVTVLADAVQREVEQPSAEPQPDHSYLPVRACRCAWPAVPAPRDDAIALLRDQPPQPRATSLLLPHRPATRRSRRRAELGDALQSSTRSSAWMPSVLGLQGREAIPALQAALEDPYVSEGEDSPVPIPSIRCANRRSAPSRPSACPPTRWRHLYRGFDMRLQASFHNPYPSARQTERRWLPRRDA